MIKGTAIMERMKAEAKAKQIIRRAEAQARAIRAGKEVRSEPA